MRGALVGAVVGIVALSGCAGQEPEAEEEVSAVSDGACAAMIVSVPQPTVSASDTVDVIIDNVDVECLDQGQTSTTAEPMTLEVMFVQGDAVSAIGSFSEADGPTVTLTATVPGDATPGRATFEVDGAEAATVTVEP